MSSKKPEIRFDEFTDDWEQRKFTEIVDRVKTSSNSNLLPKVEFEDIKAGEGRLNKDVSHKFDTRKGILFKPNNILFGKLRPYLKNWLLPDFEGIALGDFWVFKPINSDAYFTYYLIQASKYQKVANDTSGTKMPRSDWKLVSTTSFSIPCFEEQMKIGSFLKRLDNTIALHQRQLENLEKNKKAFLQKMFPKSGETVPEIRFDGFVDEWEHCRLGDYAVYRRGSFPQPYGNKEWYDGNGAMPFVQVVDVTDHLVLVDDTKQKISKLAQPKSVFVPKGKVVVTLQGSIGRVAITQYDAFVDRTILIFEDYKNSTNNYFWAYVIQQKFEIEKQKAPGGTIKTITKEALSSFEVSLPKYKEQKRIGIFFKQLDDTIVLHQKKLGKLKQIKKSFLQKMFV